MSFLYFIFFFLIKQIMCNLPVAPLTQLQTIHECHERSSSLTIDCNIGHRIRILESFYGATSEPNRDYCSEGYRTKDCKSHTSFQNACNGRSSCTVHFFRVYLPDCNANSNYLTVQYECVPERKVHGVCTNVEDISTWGTLRTTDFPHSYGFNEDCWCKLSADNNQRIVLSVISFQLFPYDPTCSETGLYLQSERNRSKDCTFLQQGHYYISSSKNLYLNFYSRKPTIRAGFWIIYEASDAKSRIRLKCGDTDEVRPALFTRFSTKKELNLTPYIYEFASSTTPGLGLQTITAKVPKTNLQLTTTFNKYNLISQGTKNYSNFFNTTPKSRHYFTTKMRLRLSTRKILTKKIITTSKMSSKTTTLKKTSTTTKTTTTTTTTTATTTTNTTPATTTTTTFTTTSTTSSKMTRKTKKTTTLKQIFTSEYLQTVTSEQKSTRLLRPKIDPTIDEFILSTSPQIPTTNIQLSDFVLEKINFDRINLTTEKADVENITKSDLVFNQSDFMVAFGIQEKNAFEKSPKVQTGKLSKTELTIVISCVIFIAMLTVVNLIIYSFKRLAKKQVPTAKIIEPGLNAADPDKKSYDILPGVGEIVLWADNDKRGYLIDINGSWAKIDGQRWIRDNMTVLHNTYKKASMAYRNKFKKKDDKKEPNDDSRLIKRIPPTIGSYALTPVPEAIEYDQSENNSRSSIREFGNFGESDYHIEHGQITSLGKRNKILCHQASLTNYSLENNSESNHLNEPNGSKHNDSWDSKEDKQDSKLELESQTNILALGDSTDSSPSFDHKLVKEDNILNKENPSNKDPSLGSNNSSIRLDNQSLKYSNQSNIPIAIVAPNKSNSSTLETKHHKKEENEIQTISLRKLQINQTSSPILDLFEKNQLIRNQLGDETTDIKLHYHNYKKRHSLSQMVNEELNYEIASSRTRLIDESSHSSLNDNVPVDTAESNLDSNSSCKLIESQSTINETVPKNKPSSTVEFDNDETNFMISKELNDESHLFTNAIKKACQIEDMIAKNVYYSIPQQENDLKNIISIIKANSDHLKTMNDDQIYDVIVNHIKKSESQTENGEDLPIIMKNLHSVKSLKNFFEVRAKSSDSEPHLNEEVKRIHSIEKSVNQGLGVCSDLEGDSKNDIIRESNAPVAPPLPEYLINREETKPKFSIKPRRSKTDSIYFYNQSNDLHDKLIREIHNKSLERSKKDTSLIFDEHGNLITKPMTQKNKTKLSKLKEINAPSTVSDKINQLGLNQTKITSFRYNKNRSQSADSKLHDRTIDMDMSNEIVDRQVQMIEMITGCKSSSHRLNDLNQNTTIRSDFSRISNSSVHSSRSMLSEAKAKLEAFGKYSKQARYESPKFDINDDLNDQILDSSIQMEPCVNEFLQTKF